MVGLCTAAAIVTALLVAVVYSAPDTSGGKFMFALPYGVSADLIIVSTEDVSATCEVKWASRSKKIPLAQGPNNYPVKSSNTSARGEVTCSQSVTVTLRSASSQSPVYPVDTLGTEYVSSASNQVIAAVEDDTSIQINDGGNIQLTKSLPFVLNDSTSTIKITSNKSVLVLEGDDLNNLVSLAPVNTWGREYVVSRARYDIIGYNVTCTLEDLKEAIKAPVDKWHSPKSGLLKCDGPVMVKALSDSATGLVHFLPAVSQYTNKVTLATGNKTSKCNLYIQIAKKDDTPNELFINDTKAGSVHGGKMRSSGAYRELHYEVGPGTYTVFHKNPSVVFLAYITDDDLNPLYLPPRRMANTGSYCKLSGGTQNDGLDNDCDGRVDEEVLNEVDDDGDGKVDEDLAVNDYYRDTRGWRLSYTVVILVLLVILFVILIAICHWQCSLCDPQVKDYEQDLMVASYDSRNTVPTRYSLSGSRSGFTISRR